MELEIHLDRPEEFNNALEKAIDMLLKKQVKEESRTK